MSGDTFFSVKDPSSLTREDPPAHHGPEFLRLEHNIEIPQLGLGIAFDTYCAGYVEARLKRHFHILDVSIAYIHWNARGIARAPVEVLGHKIVGAWSNTANLKLPVAGLRRAQIASEHIKSRGIAGSEHNHGSPRSCTHRVRHFASDTNGAYPHQLHINIRDRAACCYRNRNCR